MNKYVFFTGKSDLIAYNNTGIDELEMKSARRISELFPESLRIVG